MGWSREINLVASLDVVAEADRALVASNMGKATGRYCPCVWCTCSAPAARAPFAS